MKTKPIAVETQKFIVVHEFLAGRIAAESQASDRKLHYCYVLLLLHVARRRQLAGRKLPTTAEPKRWVMESRYSFLRVVGLQLNQSISGQSLVGFLYFSGSWVMTLTLPHRMPPTAAGSVPPGYSRARIVVVVVTTATLC